MTNATKAAQKIRAYAQENKMSLSKLAQSVGLRADHLDKILTGKRDPSVAVRRALGKGIPTINDDWSVPPDPEVAEASETPEQENKAG